MSSKPAFSVTKTGINESTTEDWNERNEQKVEDKRPIRKVQLLHGVHVQKNPHNGQEQGFRTLPNQPGPIIETREPLDERWPEKFAPVRQDSSSTLPPELTPRANESLAAWHERVGRIILENKSVTSHPGTVGQGTGATLDAGITNREQSAPHTIAPPAPTAPNVTVAPAVDIESTLRAMNTDQLKKWAADEEIPLGTAKSKDEIVKTLLANRK